MKKLAGRDYEDLLQVSVFFEPLITSTYTPSSVHFLYLKDFFLLLTIHLSVNCSLSCAHGIPWPSFVFTQSQLLLVWKDQPAVLEDFTADLSEQPVLYMKLVNFQLKQLFADDGLQH
jgi:hypothetical protein